MFFDDSQEMLKEEREKMRKDMNFELSLKNDIVEKAREERDKSKTEL